MKRFDLTIQELLEMLFNTGIKAPDITRTVHKGRASLSFDDCSLLNEKQFSFHHNKKHLFTIETEGNKVKRAIINFETSVRTQKNVGENISTYVWIINQELRKQTIV